MDAWQGKLGVRFLQNLNIINSATLSHSPCGLSMQVAYHFFSDPGPRNDHLPGGNLLAWMETRLALNSQLCSLSLDPHEMSLNMDMKMIRPVSCSLFLTRTLGLC